MKNKDRRENNRRLSRSESSATFAERKATIRRYFRGAKGDYTALLSRSERRRYDGYFFASFSSASRALASSLVGKTAVPASTGSRRCSAIARASAR